MQEDKPKNDPEASGMMERIEHDGKMIALILKANMSLPGLHFFTPDDFSQQLAYMSHPVGKMIEPHIHNPVQREVVFTQEVLIIRKGRVRVDFYSEKRAYLESRILQPGDVALLASGGHGFEVLEDLEMIEVKQGPYSGDQDKTRFEGIVWENVVLPEK